MIALVARVKRRRKKRQTKKRVEVARVVRMGRARNCTQFYMRFYDACTLSENKRESILSRAVQRASREKGSARWSTGNDSDRTLVRTSGYHRPRKDQSLLTLRYISMIDVTIGRNIIGCPTRRATRRATRMINAQWNVSIMYIVKNTICVCVRVCVSECACVCECDVLLSHERQEIDVIIYQRSLHRRSSQLTLSLQ